MIVHTLNMCLSFLSKFDKYFLILMAVELRHFFHPKCLVDVLFVLSVTQAVFIPLYSNFVLLYYNCSHIEHVHPIFMQI